MGTHSCNKCSHPIEPDWKLCPFCGIHVAATCAGCNKKLESDWLLCPFCGRSVAGPPDAARPSVETEHVEKSSKPSVETLRLSWELRVRFEDAGEQPFAVVGVEIAAAQTISAYLGAREPAKLRHVMARCLDSLLALGGDLLLPTIFQAGIRDIADHRAVLLAHLESSLTELRVTGDAVRALKLPEGQVSSFVDGATKALDPREAAGQGAIAGAAAGALLGPVGAMVGGAVGAWAGFGHTNTHNQSVLDRFDNAFVAFAEAGDRMLNSAWDLVVDRTCKEGLVLLGSEFFLGASKAWADLESTVGEQYRIGHEGLGRAAMETFLSKWGPHPTALTMLIRGAVQTERGDVSTRESAKLLLSAYPFRADTYEVVADLELLHGDHARAAGLVQQGLALAPNHLGLLLSRIEAVAAEGAVDEAVLLAKDPNVEGSACDGTRHLARGLVRRALLDVAAASIRDCIASHPTPHALRRRFSSDPVLQCLWVNNILPTATLEEELQGVAEAHLAGVAPNAFLGDVPSDRRSNAAAEGYLPLSERTLFFLDWSVWDNGKTGFAITTLGARWKCLWQEAVHIPFNAIQPGSIRAQGSNLMVGRFKVDMDAPALATAVRGALVEITSLIRG